MYTFFNFLLQIFKSTILLFLILYDFKIYNFLDQVLLILTGSILNESICFFIVSDTESDAGSASDSATDSVSDSDADFEEITQDLIDTIEEDEAGQAGRIAEDAAEATRRNIYFEAVRLQIDQDLIRIAEAESEGSSETKTEGFSGTGRLSKKLKRED